jgi:hypothetical protein
MGMFRLASFINLSQAKKIAIKAFLKAGKACGKFKTQGIETARDGHTRPARQQANRARFPGSRVCVRRKIMRKAAAPATFLNQICQLQLWFKWMLFPLKR